MNLLILLSYCELKLKANMENLILESTAYTPLVNFNSQNGVMEIKGRSIPEQADEFWVPIINWFDKYLLNPSDYTTFKIDLEYFNISSSKRILMLLYKLNNLAKLSANVKVEWHYRLADEDMFEVGQDYKYMIKVPFEFHAYEEQELAIA